MAWTIVVVVMELLGRSTKAGTQYLMAEVGVEDTSVEEVAE